MTTAGDARIAPSTSSTSGFARTGAMAASFSAAHSSRGPSLRIGSIAQQTQCQEGWMDRGFANRGALITGLAGLQMRPP